MHTSASERLLLSRQIWPRASGACILRVGALFVLSAEPYGKKVTMKKLWMRLARYIGLVSEADLKRYTKCGEFIECEHTAGKEFLRLHHPSNSEMVLEPNGSISMTDASGAVLRMDAHNNEISVQDSFGNLLYMNSVGSRVVDSNGNAINMAAAGVTVQASKIVITGSEVHLGGTGGEPIIKGQSFLEMFATHIHTVEPVVGGPTSPPIPQGEISALSTTVRTL